MTTVKISRVSVPVLLTAFTTAFALTLAGCGTDTDTQSASTGSAADLAEAPATAMATSATSCPTTPAEDGAPEWTLSGTTGSIAVTGSTDSKAPHVKVDAPFTVAETQVHTLRNGDGPVVADMATVSVCYMGVNGRDGTVFDSSYERGAPVEFPLDGVVPGFQKAIAGQKVGSTVAVAMTSDDGYPNGQPGAGIQPGDTLIFAIKVLNIAS